MGNQTSSSSSSNTELKAKPISQILDYIATHYILTMDFVSLRKMYEKEYCDKLVILTSDIIERNFTNMEITYLAQRVKNGVEVNEITKDNVIFFNKEQLPKLDVQNSVKKKRICVGIAKFYIKITHLFAAIVTTINPTYVYKDQEGNTVRADFSEKDKIPVNAPRDIYKLNICSNRINALKPIVSSSMPQIDPNNSNANNSSFLTNLSNLFSSNKTNNDLGIDEKGEMNIGPKMCDFNVGDNGQDKTLQDEPGIPELMELYLDDNYDYQTGKFTGMTEKTKQVFQKDLKIFYNVFTGSKEVPEGIQKFSDIKLRDYHKMPNCQNGELRKKYKGPLTDKLFNDYAENLKKMIRTANNNQEALLTIINQLFVYTIDPQTKEKQIRINPTLTEESLQEIVVKTRALIIKLYLTCEMDYVNGLKIYEAIVEKKILETAQNQITNLEKMSEQLMVDEKVPEPAEVAELNSIKETKEMREEAEDAKDNDEYAKEEDTKKIEELELNPPNPPLNPPNPPLNPPNPPLIPEPNPTNPQPNPTNPQPNPTNPQPNPTNPQPNSQPFQPNLSPKKVTN